MGEHESKIDRRWLYQMVTSADSEEQMVIWQNHLDDFCDGHGGVGEADLPYLNATWEREHVVLDYES